MASNMIIEILNIISISHFGFWSHKERGEEKRKGKFQTIII